MSNLTMEQTWSKNQAELIIQEHVHVMMCSASDYDPKDEDELKDFMLSECAYILSRKLLESEYTPMEYNAVRNAVTMLIHGFFAMTVIDDEEDCPAADEKAKKDGISYQIRLGAYAIC